MHDGAVGIIISFPADVLLQKTTRRHEGGNDSLTQTVMMNHGIAFQMHRHLCLVEVLACEMHMNACGCELAYWDESLVGTIQSGGRIK
jgi:hypothetical protein